MAKGKDPASYEWLVDVIGYGPEEHRTAVIHALVIRGDLTALDAFQVELEQVTIGHVCSMATLVLPSFSSRIS